LGEVYFDEFFNTEHWNVLEVPSLVVGYYVGIIVATVAGVCKPVNQVGDTRVDDMYYVSLDGFHTIQHIEIYNGSDAFNI
jgi:hypothetical protein